MPLPNLLRSGDDQQFLILAPQTHNSMNNIDHGGLVVKSQLRGRRALKIYCVWGLLNAKSYVGGQMSSCWCGVEVWSRGCGLRCRPCHLTVAENGEVRLKITLVLLQNRALT
ncbi:hypothetical protein AVEN_135177-1 [Araneus ventricosus]|uniref:Uncharacterized protein n=1 Tax=Araneus ventricosus TaxID=182803 RepID=A0A4Y2ITB5_ARAVE|nr:hypothetical protein AVEN_135177-1 [Araneus ventricosus]